MCVQQIKLWLCSSLSLVCRDFSATRTDLFFQTTVCVRFHIQVWLCVCQNMVCAFRSAPILSTLALCWLKRLPLSTKLHVQYLA